MRATYGRNLMAQRLLETHKIESFVPMRKRTVKSGHRIKTDLIPVVRDLIFVHGEKAEHCHKHCALFRDFGIDICCMVRCKAYDRKDFRTIIFKGI